MIKMVKFATVAVSDQDRSLKFFTECLGFRIDTDQPYDDQQRWIELRIPGAETRIVLFTSPEYEDRIGGFTNITFACDDVERTYAELVGRGVKFVQSPTKADWGASAIFKDPDGNQFVLGSRR